MTTATYAPAAPAVAMNPQLSPYGLFGDLARTVAPVAGQALGSVFGNQQLGGQIGNTLGSIASLLPFGVQPGVPSFAAQYPQYQYPQHQAALVQAALAQQQLAPYGIFGDIIRSVAPTGGQIVGSVFGDAQTGGQVGSIIGQLGGLLPFAAQPGMLHPQQLQQAQQVAQAQQAIAQQAVARQLQQNPIQQAQLAPYGFLGGALGNIVGGLGGSAIGGLFGNPSAGSSIGSTAGSILGAILPFQATPSPWMSFPTMPYHQQPMWN